MTSKTPTLESGLSPARVARILLFVFVVFSLSSLNAQWIPTGPAAKNIRALSRPADNPNMIFAASYGWGVFVSLDGGTNWTNHKAGLTNTFVRCICARSSLVAICGTNDNIARSSDGGLTWTPVQTTAFSVRSITCDAASGHWFAATYGDDVYLSVNDGLTWSKVIVRDPVSNQTLHHFHSIARYGNDSVYAGGSIADVSSGGALFATHDGGVNWIQIQRNVGVRSSVNSISISPSAPATSLIFGTGLKGVYKSTDGGDSLFNIDGKTLSNPLPDSEINATTFTSAYRICGTDATCGTYLRALGDISFGWSAASGLPGLPFIPESYLDFAGGSKILVGFNSKGVYRSLDSGKTFAPATTGLMGTSIRDVKFTASGRIIVAAGFGDRIFHSDNDGASWTQDSIESYSSIFQLAQSPNGTLYAAQYGTGVQRSTNLGSTWVLTDTAVINHFARTVAADPVNNAIVYAGTGDGVFKSANAGATWSNVNNGVIPFSTSIHSMAISPLVPGLLLVGTDSSFLYRTTNGGTVWTHVGAASGFLPSDIFIRSITFDPVSSALVYVGADSGRVYKSTDGGANWSLLNKLTTNFSVRKIVVDPAQTSRLFAATFGDGLFVSEDGGAVWSAYNSGLTSLELWTIAIRPGSSPEQLWIGSDLQGVFKKNYAPPGSCTACGDANGDGLIDISDAVFLISYIFSGGVAPGDCNYPKGKGDANGSGTVDIADAVCIISYVFAGGGPPHCV